MNKLKHIAFIMDGNGRWAKSRHLPRHLGHKKGIKNIIKILYECLKLDIFCVSFYCFSTENWNRPQDEIDHLFNYLEIFFKENIEELQEKGVKIHVSGDISKLPISTQKTIFNAKDATKNCSNLIFNICLNYGGRDEIIRAIKKINEEKFDVKKLNEENFKLFLDTKDLPDVDLLIRTSGEERISNFLLYELAYAEFIFNKLYWPQYTIKAFHEDLEKYYKRTRRFGGLSDGN